MNFLVPTNDSSSFIISGINKAKHIPLICSSINASTNIIKHHAVNGIIIGENQKGIDALEFILHASELDFYLNKIMIYDIKENQYLKDIELLDSTICFFNKNNFITKFKETFNFYEKPFGKNTGT